MHSHPPPGRATTVVGPEWRPMTDGPSVPVDRSTTWSRPSDRTSTLVTLGRSPFRRRGGSGVADGAALAGGREACPEADGAVRGAVAEGPDATPRSWRGAVNQTAATARTTVATRAAASGPRTRSARPRRRPPPRPVRSRQVDSPSRCGGIRQSSATLRIRPASRSSSGPGAAVGGVPSRGFIESPQGHRAARRPLAGSAAGSVAGVTSAAWNRRRRLACERLRIDPTVPGLIPRKPPIWA